MLHELVRFADTCSEIDSEPGFTTRTVRWLAEINSDGQFVNIIPLGETRGEQTGKCPEMHGMQAGGRAHFLVETVQTISLLFKQNEDSKNVVRAKTKHHYFRDMVYDAAADVPALSPLSVCLNSNEQLNLLRERLGEEKAKPTDWLRWSIEGVDPLEIEEVRDWWRSWRKKDLSNEGGVDQVAHAVRSSPTAESVQVMTSFLSGGTVVPVATHPKITGLSGVGGLGTGDVMVGFDKSAFCSFGLEQSSNAAMDEDSIQKYADALNHLIRNRSRRLASTLVIHWFKDAVALKNDPLSIFYEPPEVTEASAKMSAQQILESLRAGERPVKLDNTFYAIMLSGASGRVMVRDWIQDDFKDLVGRIQQWFSDFKIVSRSGIGPANEPKFMAVCGSFVRDLKDLPAPTTVSMWRVAVGGLPIPLSVMTQAVERFRADLIGDKPFNHARMGLMKAFFIRKGGNDDMSVYLNKEHHEPSYQCGRLLAMLASLQNAALGDIGAGVVQRYYVAASQTPGLTLGRLIGNAKNHLGKLDGGLAHWYENQIAEIMTRIRDSIPSTLTLEQQGMFALGYYQQIAANRAGKVKTEQEKGEES